MSGPEDKIEEMDHSDEQNIKSGKKMCRDPGALQKKD